MLSRRKSSGDHPETIRGWSPDFWAKSLVIPSISLNFVYLYIAGINRYSAQKLNWNKYLCHIYQNFFIVVIFYDIITILTRVNIYADFVLWIINTIFCEFILKFRSILGFLVNQYWTFLVFTKKDWNEDFYLPKKKIVWSWSQKFDAIIQLC